VTYRSGVILVVAATERELAGAGGAATLACGIGPVEAAAATAQALAVQAPAAVLHVGIAGARGIEAPQVVIGSEAVYEDAADGTLVRRRVLPDAGLLERARRALPDAQVLPIGTSARVGGTSGCRVEAMEGFAVLRAAELAGIPALEVRAVSNEIDEPDRARWRFDDALGALEQALPLLLAELR
jgi:nucleoside phosphorylase